MLNNRESSVVLYMAGKREVFVYMPIYKMTGTKDGKQKYRVRINYQDASGKNRQIDRVAYGNQEAKELERTLLHQIKSEAPARRLTLRDIYEEYIRAKAPEVRETSLQKTRTVLEHHILPVLGDVSLSKLSVRALQDWKSYLEDKTVTAKSGEEQPLSLRTKQNVYGELRAFLNYAVKMDYLPKNPLMRVGNFKDPNTLHKEMDFYTADEFRAFIAKALECAQNSPNNSEWDYYVFFNIAFYTGMRKGEIHALKWSDIDGDYISVKRSITQKLKGEDRETPPKNKTSIRTLQIPEPLKKILADHKARYRSLQGFSDDFRICGGTRPLRDTSIQKANERYAKLAGLKTIRIHDFRHSHASLLANNGINIQEIARRLGHAKIEMTWNTYSHLYPREEERAVNILNKIV